MSQVHVEEVPHDLKRSVHNAELIVVARDLKKTVTHKQKVFPKSTHFRKAEETRYTELAREFEVVRVITSSLRSSPKPGSTIRVWVEPSYDEDATRRYHEQGLSKSPVVVHATPTSPPTSAERLLFLTPHEKIYRARSGAAEEGLASLSEVEDLLHGQKNPTLFSMEDRSAFHRDGKAIVIGEDGTVFVHVIENQGEKVRERRCQAVVSPPALAEVKRLVEQTQWQKLEHTGTLLPDETRPSIYVGLHLKRQWRIEPAGTGPERDAYAAMLRLAQEQCQGGTWTSRAAGEVDFRHWPARIKVITQ